MAAESDRSPQATEAEIEFCRRAAPILARERGLTAACRVKLAGLAHSLGLDEGQMAAALSRLRASLPSPQAQRFRRRLRKDLAGKARAILGPTIVRQILAAAREKYGLDEATARQLLDDVATELHLTCITPTEALQGLAGQIDQAIGPATWLAREGWDRLRSAGLAWGIELEVIDELIEERLAANRADQARRRLRTGLTLGTFSAAALLVVLLVGLLILHRSLPRDAPEASLREEDAFRAAPAPRASAALPAWWDVDLAVEAARTRSWLSSWPTLAQSWDDLLSPQAERRARGYEQWLAQVPSLIRTDEPSQAAQRLLAGCYALEPSDAAAGRLREALAVWLPGPGQPLPPPDTGWGPARWAADMAGRMLVRCPPGPRFTALQQTLEHTLGEAPPPQATSEASAALRRLAVRAAYRQLAAAADQRPSEVAALVARLRSEAAACLSPQERLEADTELLVAALPSAGAAWPAYQQAMIAVVASEDTAPALRLTELLRHLQPDPLVRYLSGLLADRAGLTELPPSRGQTILALRRALGGSAGWTLPDRWYLLQTAVEPLLAQPLPVAEQELVLRVAQLAHYGTLAAALARGESGWPVFDAGIEQPPKIGARPGTDPAARPSSAASGTARPAAARADTAESPARHREVRRALDLLRTRGSMAATLRESGWRALVELVAEGVRPGPAEAALVARELLVPRPPEEHAKLLVWLAVLRPWPQLALAVADALPATGEVPPRLREIVAVLLETPAEEATSAEALRQRLLARALETIQREAEHRSDPLFEEDLLDQLAECLTRTYRERAALWHIPPQRIGADQPPSELLAALATQMQLASSANAESDPSRAGPPAAEPSAADERLVARRRAIALLADDDLGRTVVWQRLLLEQTLRQIARERPGALAVARQIVAETETRYRASPSRLAQLGSLEAAWLRLWMLYASP